MDGHLKHSEAPLHPLLPSLVMLVESLLCAGTCFRSGLGGKLLGCRCPSDAPLLIRCSISLPDTSPRGSRSAQSDGRTRGMIYNPFQGIIAANGQSQCVLPKAGGGGQNQLMESLTWPGLMAECGLTSGSDKGPSEAELIRRLDKKEEKHPPPPRSMSCTMRRACRANRAAGHGPLSIRVILEVGEAPAAHRRPTSVFTTEPLDSTWPHT